MDLQCSNVSKPMSQQELIKQQFVVVSLGKVSLDMMACSEPAGLTMRGFAMVCISIPHVIYAAN